jgi:uncharacterized membrane protein (DUF485 family)
MTDTKDTDDSESNDETAEDSPPGNSARFRYTEDDMVAAHMAWWSGSASWKVFLRFAVLICLLYIGLVYLANWGAPTTPFQIAAALLVGLVVTLGGFAIGYVVTPRRARKIHDERQAHAGEQHLEWDEESLRLRSPGGTNELPWTVFQSWLAGPDTLLLYQANNLFHAIPKRALSEAQFEDIIRQLREAGVPEKPRFGFQKSGS